MFLTWAFHIDDPVFLWPAKQIERDPLRPFDVKVNWYGYTEPMGRLLTKALGRCSVDAPLSRRQSF